MTKDEANTLKAIECATQITVAAVSKSGDTAPYSESGKLAAEYFEAVFLKIKALTEK